MRPPILLVDNKSALTIFDQGGTWRTRYFAVRAGRLGDESRAGNVDLRHCPTLDMGADSLTKMGSAILLENMRGCLYTVFPPIPGADKKIKDMEESWWVSMVMEKPRLLKKKKKKKKKRRHQTSTTPGRSQQGDMAGDGPSQRNVYMGRVALLWLSNRDPRMQDWDSHFRHHYDRPHEFYIE